MIHHVEYTLDPNIVGKDRVRKVELQGSTLTLRSTDGETLSVIIWEREAVSPPDR